MNLFLITIANKKRKSVTDIKEFCFSPLTDFHLCLNYIAEI